MDVDEGDTTQKAREVEDYGLVVDFSGVDKDDLEVRILVLFPAPRPILCRILDLVNRST